MQWIFNNPVASMWGPYFLAFYFSVFVLLLAICWWHRRKSDKSVQLSRLAVPADPDPYRLAYLRGGGAEVLRLATVDLYQRGLLKEAKKSLFGRKRLQLTESASRSGLPAILQVVANYYQSPRAPTEMFSAGIQSQISSHFAQWDDWIEAEQLQVSDGVKSAHGTLITNVIVGFLLLGFYKLGVALWTGHDNVGFLFVMMMAGSILLSLARLPRFTTRGKQYIDDLQRAYASYRKPTWSANQAPGIGDDYALPVMAMGLFGIAALQAGPYSMLYDQFAKAASLGSSCGGGCGSGSSCGAGCGGGGCGGGCGGCGG